MITTLRSKAADIGGDGNESSFEMGFSELAHAYAREKGPTLAPYEVGFQVLERSDNGRRAVGITGFDVGGTLLYLPVFWLGGQIKGHELLFLPESNLFVPLKESWLNYIMQRQSPRIGTERSRERLTRSFRRPDLLRLTRSVNKRSAVQQQFFKLSSVKEAMAGMFPRPPVRTPLKQASVKEAMLDVMRSLPPIFEQSPLLDFLSTVPGAVAEFRKLSEQNPEIAAMACSLHGEELLTAVKVGQSQPPLAREMPMRERSSHKCAFQPLTRPDVSIFHYQPDVADRVPESFSIEDRQALQRDGMLVRDRRKDAEVTQYFFDTPDAVATRVTTPKTSGVYEVILRDGGLAKCAVLFGALGPGGPSRQVTVLALGEDTCKYAHVPAERVHVLSEIPGALPEFVAQLPAASNGMPVERCVLFDKQAATLPMLVGDGVRTAQGGFHYHLVEARPLSDLDWRKQAAHCSLIVDERGDTGIRCTAERICVPSSAKVARLADSQLELGNARSLTDAAATKFATVQVAMFGPEVVIRRGNVSYPPVLPKTACDHLITRHGFREADARQILKMAASRPVRLYAKFASPYIYDDYTAAPVQDFDETNGTWTMMSGESYPQDSPQRDMLPVNMPPNEEAPAPQVNYVDGEGGEAMGIAQQAAQTGQKDVFDASVLTTMLRNMRDDQLIDRYLPALSKCMDALGRMLFGFYWHQEDYSERYGDRDMPELEDSIRNMFEGVGDLVLKLFQKTVDARNGGSLGANLADVAGAS